MNNVPNVLGFRLSASNYESITDLILSWAIEDKAKTVFFANVHMLIEARRCPELKTALENASLVNPDGVPLVWTLNAFGAKANRIYGPDCMLNVLKACCEKGVPVGLYGGSRLTLAKLLEVLQSLFPPLQVAYAFSPPFKDWTKEDEAMELNAMENSGARILFVGLGCPKQELWIARNQKRLDVVMLGVGAAFDFISGTKPQAPRWMMKSGLEWLFRCSTEPKRLLGRYTQSNPLFLLLVARQLTTHTFGRILSKIKRVSGSHFSSNI